MADFNTVLRLWKLEHRSTTATSPLTGFDLCFEALGLGDQGDLFPKDIVVPLGDAEKR